MMKPEFSKPFDLAAARAGAPFAGENGEAVRVLIWDRKHPSHPIIAIEEDGEQEAVEFRIDGTNDVSESLGVVRKLVMLPLGVIAGKPVFAGDQLLLKEGFRIDGYEDYTGPNTVMPGWFKEWTPEIWQWPAAKVYPDTRASEAYLISAYYGGGPVNGHEEETQAFFRIANAAIRHAIDAGQVVDAEQSAEAIRNAYADGQAIAYKHEAGGRAARDMAIAEAVRIHCGKLVGGSHTAQIDLAALIANIK